MAGWHHWLDGHEFEWTPGVSDGRGGLVCCDSWGRKESDMTERLNWTESLMGLHLDVGCLGRWLRLNKVLSVGPKSSVLIRKGRDTWDGLQAVTVKRQRLGHRRKVAAYSSGRFHQKPTLLTSWSWTSSHCFLKLSPFFWVLFPSFWNTFFSSSFTKVVRVFNSGSVPLKISVWCSLSNNSLVRYRILGGQIIFEVVLEVL